MAGLLRKDGKLRRISGKLLRATPGCKSQCCGSTRCYRLYRTCQADNATCPSDVIDTIAVPFDRTPSLPLTVIWRGRCYAALAGDTCYVLPTETGTHIPAHAAVVPDSDGIGQQPIPCEQIPGCLDQHLAILAQSCPGQDGAPDVYFCPDFVAFAGVRNVNGFCYYVDPNAPLVPHPLDAIVVDGVHASATDVGQSCCDCVDGCSSGELPAPPSPANPDECVVGPAAYNGGPVTCCCDRHETTFTLVNARSKYSYQSLAGSYDLKSIEYRLISPVSGDLVVPLGFSYQIQVSYSEIDPNNPGSNQSGITTRSFGHESCTPVLRSTSFLDGNNIVDFTLCPATSPPPGPNVGRCIRFDLDISCDRVKFSGVWVQYDQYGRVIAITEWDYELTLTTSGNDKCKNTMASPPGGLTQPANLPYQINSPRRFL